MLPPLKPDVKSPLKTSNVIEASETGSLFESDDEDNLFDTFVKRPTSVTKDGEKKHSNTVSSLPENNAKFQEKKDLLDNEPPSLSWKNDNSKSTTGLFSDDDDDIFGTPVTRKESDISVPGTEVPITKESSPKISPVPFKSEESAASKPTSIFASPPDLPTPSEPVSISEPFKTSHSLFSSPSDDDDDLFSSISKPAEKNKSALSFTRDPPPLPPLSSAREPKPFSKGLIQPDVFPHSDNNEPLKVNLKENPKETSSSLFSSLSDEEDIFSPAPSPKNSQIAPSLPSNKKTDSSVEPQLVENPTAVENSKDKNHIGKETINVFPDGPSNSNSNQSTRVHHSSSFSEASLNLPLETNDVAIISKEDDIFKSTEDDLFGDSKSLPEPSSSFLTVSDSSSPLTTNVQLQRNSEVLPTVSENAAPSVIPRSLEDNPSTSNKRTPDPNVLSFHAKPDSAGTEKPEESAVKPPVGGVALFIGKELDAQINKQRTLLKSVEKENKQKIDTIFGDVHDRGNEDNQNNGPPYDDSDDIFSISSRNSTSQLTSSVLHRQSPPLLPEETEGNSEAENYLFSTKQIPPKVQEKISKIIPVKSDEPDWCPDTTTDPQDIKSDKLENHEKGKESKETSPTKKPPVGGVSVFGGSGMKNSELFAKVLQRKSMLACESDSSEEDVCTESTDIAKPSILSAKTLILPTEKDTSSKPEMPVNATSSHSIHPPVFSPECPASKSGGDEDGVSFDDPATQSNVLQSLNKVRHYKYSFLSYVSLLQIFLLLLCLLYL